ncbi:MAG: GNAT family N-acetyltransferase [Candidatus Krumholzibacteriia bacterium]
MSLAYAWATAAELPAARAFMTRAYGADSLQAAPGRFDWLCGAHPRGPAVSLCRDGGRIVGACCHVPTRLALGGRDVEAAFGFDLIVDAACRGRGIASALLALRLERYAASLSTGQSPAMAALYAKAGGRDLGPIVRALRVRRPGWSGPPRALARDGVAWGLGLARGRGDGSRRALTVAEAAARLDGTATRLTPAEAGTRPDAAAFAWRYGGPVYADHLCWEVTAGAARGLLVTRIENACEVIVDIFSSPPDLPALLRAAAATTPAPRLTAACHGARPAAAFAAAGWLVRPVAARFVVLAADAALRAELADRPWAVFAGESDLDLLRRPAAPSPPGRETP